MRRRDFLKNAALGAAAFALPSALAAPGPKKKKLNFVFFLVDDLGWADLGCQGSTFYETPNVDALAATGMRFTNGYAACPVCSPTRASIMAGKYPARMDTTDWFGGRRAGRLLPAPYKNYLPLEEVTVAEALKAAGYRTFFAGKWHLGAQPYFPEKQGFDINKGGHQRGWPPGGYFSPFRNPRLTDGPKGQHLADRLGDESVAFLDTVRDRPFLLYLSFYSVHTPLQAKKQLIEKYKAKAAKLPESDSPEFLPEGRRKARQIQKHPVYSGMVQVMDENVGKVLGKLDKLGLADNTAVIFMSDNGGLSTSEGSPTSNLPLRAGKGWLYEGGIREPMIIRRPGVTKPGSTCDVPVISTDFYPTMLDMAGLPPRPKQHVDGVSLAGLLASKHKTLDRKAIYWHYPHYGNQGGRPGSAVRAGDFKLIEFFEDNSVELYNLRDDIGEKNDLAKKMPEKAAELRNMLRAWREEVDAKMMKPNPKWRPRR